MKRLLYIFALIFTVSFASAQDKKIDAPAQAKQDAKELQKYLDLSDAQTEDLYYVFEMKYSNLNVGLSEERKTILFSAVDEKIKASLKPEQYSKLLENKELYTKLTR
ncbi:hypothetical protein [Flavobacterium croceum]|jgi:hypothetical protein|uniref:Uncharacterized protein n=1 Tax=Flavobacterium croceum DSM 17960 TaxID=1121886 RepID=A0A2S4N9X2_9FLAO|nr:hypothetical protein [Flavobacterium croceum]POS02501.1 hypothetical protein Q361_1037 [Flavobacterium croceum DSM 17960]